VKRETLTVGALRIAARRMTVLEEVQVEPNESPDADCSGISEFGDISDFREILDILETGK